MAQRRPSIVATGRSPAVYDSFWAYFSLKNWYCPILSVTFTGLELQLIEACRAKILLIAKKKKNLVAANSGQWIHFTNLSSSGSNFWTNIYDLDLVSKNLCCTSSFNQMSSNSFSSVSKELLSSLTTYFTAFVISWNQFRWNDQINSEFTVNTGKIQFYSTQLET